MRVSYLASARSGTRCVAGHALGAGGAGIRPGAERQRGSAEFDDVAVGQAPWLADPPDWGNWLAAARRVEPGLPPVGHAGDLSFREELHAFEALIAGQGIAIYSDLLAARALEGGVLVKAFDLALPGLGFYLTHLPDHPKQPAIEAFATWIDTAATATPPERRDAARAGIAAGTS